MQPTNNAVRRDASPFEMQRGLSPRAALGPPRDIVNGPGPVYLGPRGNAGPNGRVEREVRRGGRGFRVAGRHRAVAPMAGFSTPIADVR